MDACGFGDHHQLRRLLSWAFKDAPGKASKWQQALELHRGEPLAISAAIGVAFKSPFFCERRCLWPWQGVATSAAAALASPQEPGGPS